MKSEETPFQRGSGAYENSDEYLVSAWLDFNTKLQKYTPFP